MWVLVGKLSTENWRQWTQGVQEEQDSQDEKTELMIVMQVGKKLEKEDKGLQQLKRYCC